MPIKVRVLRVGSFEMDIGTHPSLKELSVEGQYG